MKDDGYEFQLCDALMGQMGAGTEDLEGLAAGLQAKGLPAPDGASWTAQLLGAELRRIGNPPPKPACAPLVHVKREVTAALPRQAGAKPAGGDVESTTQQILKTGLRNLWYVAAASRDVTDKPHEATLLGEKLVLWRDSAGKVHAVENRCPHRGIKLSIGAVDGDNIRCAYHGIQVDGNGTVTDVPAYPACAYNGKKMVRDYPAFEHYQGIWVYMGDELHPEPPPLELPPELTDAEWSGVLHTDTWPGHYQYIYDNIADPMHGSYLHGTTVMQGQGLKTDTLGLKDTGHGFEVFREGQLGVSFDWMEFIDGASCKYMRIKIPFAKAAGPGGQLQIVFFVSPVDEGRTSVFIWRSRKVSGWHADLWHFLYKTRLGRYMDAVLAQDQVALNAMPPWPPKENLYQHDVGLVRLRRHMEQAAQAQARELHRIPSKSETQS
jgi:phenylpropionate dioxygenase-like ring-hydroxylating dioxygenase large terminal subunit